MDPVGILVVFTNVTVFIVAQLSFFWFVASRTVGNVVRDKERLVKSIARNVPGSAAAFEVDPHDLASARSVALNARRQIDVENWNAVVKYAAPPFYVSLSFTAASLLWVLYKHRTVRARDFLVLFTVFFAFFTEIVFYFVVIARANVLADADVIIAILEGQPACSLICAYGFCQCL